jgi:hypothetical protein
VPGGLRRAAPPRDIVATSDAAAPDDRASTYAEVREQWLSAGAFLLPDVVDEVWAAEKSVRATPRLRAEDVRIPFPEGTRRARLRRLHPAFALAQLRGGRRVLPSEVAGVRAGVLLVEVETPGLDEVAQHYRMAMRALGMTPRVEGPSKWIDEPFIQMRGAADGVDVSVTARPNDRGGVDVSVLWIERVTAGTHGNGRTPR